MHPLTLHFFLIFSDSFTLSLTLSLSHSLSLSVLVWTRAGFIHLPNARAPFFPRHFTPSFSLHSLTVFSLPSFVVPHCPRSPPCPSLLALAAHSERFPPLSPSPSPCPFRSPPSLIYCITVHEVANLRRVILYKYVSQINIRATICTRVGGCKTSSSLSSSSLSSLLSSLSFLPSVRLSRRGIQRVRLAIPRIEQIRRFLITKHAPVAAHTDSCVYAAYLINERDMRLSDYRCAYCLVYQVKLEYIHVYILKYINICH